MSIYYQYSTFVDRHAWKRTWVRWIARYGEIESAMIMKHLDHIIVDLVIKGKGTVRVTRKIETRKINEFIAYARIQYPDMGITEA